MEKQNQERKKSYQNPSVVNIFFCNFYIGQDWLTRTGKNEINSAFFDLKQTEVGESGNVHQNQP